MKNYPPLPTRAEVQAFLAAIPEPAKTIVDQMDSAGQEFVGLMGLAGQRQYDIGIDDGLEAVITGLKAVDQDVISKTGVLSYISEIRAKYAAATEEANG